MRTLSRSIRTALKPARQTGRTFVVTGANGGIGLTDRNCSTSTPPPGPGAAGHPWKLTEQALGKPLPV
jgi:hypothetical protein